MSEMSDVASVMGSMPSVQQTALNSLYGGRDRQLAAQAAYYNNQKLAAQLPFVAPQSQADLQKAQLANQYYGSTQEADINAKNATAQNQAAAAGLERGQTANLNQAQWNSMYASSPDYVKPQMLADRQNAMRANSALAGTGAPGYNGQQQAPQSSFAPQDIAAARQAQQSGMMPPPQDGEMPQSAMAGGQGKAPGLVPYNQTNAPQYQQSPPQGASSAMAGMQPQPPQSMVDNNAATTLYNPTGSMKDQADLAQSLAVGDAGQRSNYITNKKALTSTNAVNDLFYDNPKALTEYSGIVGQGKYKKDSAESHLLGHPVSPEFQAMQSMVQTYSNITPDALSKAYTGGATIGSVDQMSNVIKKGFTPGATEGQNLYAQTILKNLQAADLQSQAKAGGKFSSDDFQKLTGATVDHDFAKNPIVPKMTGGNGGQAEAFLHSLSPQDSKKYMPAVMQMLQQTGQLGG